MTHPKLIQFSAERIEWVIDQSFATTLRRLGSTLKQPRWLKMALFLRLKSESKLRLYFNDIAGDVGLMILGTIPHGRIFSSLGGPPESQLFLIGNPLIALTMMRVHPQAGVYAPLRVMFSGAGPNKTTITYDRPSKVFGQWSEPIFNETGKLLDGKMEALIRTIS